MDQTLTRRDERAPSRIPAFGDNTVARIRSKYEARFSQRFDEEANRQLAEEIYTRGSAKLGSGRLFDRKDAARMAGLFVKIHEGAPFLVASRDEVREGTRYKPRSWALMHMRLNASADERDRVALRSATLRATRRMADYRVNRSTFAWSIHAQTRLHERTGETVMADEEIASAVIASAAILQLACLPRYGVPNPGGMAIPCHEGLLLGRLAGIEPGTLMSEQVRCDRHGHSRGTRRFGDGEEETGTTFFGATYIGPDEMRPDQRAFRAAMAELAGRFAPMSAAITTAFAGRGIAETIGDTRGRTAERETAAAMMARLMPPGGLAALKRLAADPATRRALNQRPKIG